MQFYFTFKVARIESKASGTIYCYLLGQLVFHLISLYTFIAVYNDHKWTPSGLGVQLMTNIRLVSIALFVALFIGVTMRLSKLGTSRRPGMKYASGEGFRASILGSFSSTQGNIHVDEEKFVSSGSSYLDQIRKTRQIKK